MKKSICFLLTIVFLLSFRICFAEGIRKMELSWSLDASGVSLIKLYYANSQDMSNRKWHQNCQAPIENPIGSGSYTMICLDIPVTEYPAYIQIVAQLSDLSEIVSNVQVIASEPVYTPKIMDVIVK